MTGRDCKDCRYCEGIHGFMCRCNKHDAWDMLEIKVKSDTETYLKGNYTARCHARVCEFYDGKEAEE